jgi:RNA-binding protein 23/39
MFVTPVNLAFRPKYHPREAHCQPRIMSSGIDVETLLDEAETSANKAKEPSTNDKGTNADERRHRVRDYDSASDRDRKRRDRSRDLKSERDRKRSRSPGGRRYRDGDYYRGSGRSRRSRTPDDGDRYRPGGNRRRERSRSRNRYNDRDRGRNGHARDSSSKRENKTSSPKSPAQPIEGDRDRRTVFVQQLPAALRERDLKKFFSGIGEVREAQIVRDKFSGRSKG